ncbi:chitin synthase-domain-containing protein [Phascolomyces articulosus]|uniref:Chitin synthase n=1 Tax=Phascolomyces articulosus TaxID=60185 RepID=A0AAD5P9H4_9FUNG|nr:chitin synthase-domain-containing protein [Phascolomyces articulosus]
MEQHNHNLQCPPLSSSNNPHDNVANDYHSDRQHGGGSGWFYNFLFGKENTAQRQHPQQPEMMDRTQTPSTRIMDGVSSAPPPPMAATPSGSRQQPFMLTSPYRPYTAPACELPPSTETPPVPPPRLIHHHQQQQQQQQQQFIFPDPSQSHLQTPSGQRYQRGNRVSATSTLVDISGDDTGATPHVAPSDTSRMRFGPAPAHTARRYATQRIRLTKGNLVVNQRVPERLYDAIPRKDDEFAYMRYTAVTCDPDEVPNKNYEFRQQIFDRKTELFIVITMYNEDDILFARTLHGVMKNVAFLCHKNSAMWGPEGWKKVVVSIVADGRKVINKRVLTILACLGVYQAGVAKNVVDDKPVEAHVYEFTTQMSLTEDMTIKGTDKGIVPVQILFCLKEKNAKKINSHRWFFNAFGPLLKPEVCVLLDVGTRPGGRSIYDLWKTFHLNPQVGGACGEIRALLGPCGKYLLNPLVAAQNFEYKMSNILDKPMESVFGYISVLPGAFSAYRYSALQNDINGQGPLEKYFKGETLHKTNDGGLFQANMYLAEDRILCYELVAKRKERWVLRYCKSAFAVTDVPETLPEFISQRRRWLNGSFFASVYSLWNFSSMWRSDHSFTRLLLLTIETIYNSISLIFNWISLGNFYIAFYCITSSLTNEHGPLGDNQELGELLSEILRYGYLFVIVVVFICSMGNRPQVSKWLFTACLVAFSIIMIYMLAMSGWLVSLGIRESVTNTTNENNGELTVSKLMENEVFRNIIISLMTTWGLYLVSSFLYLQPWHMINPSFLFYLILLPGFINILTIYAFCNTHDVSWGTKGDNTVSKDLGVAKKQKKDDGESSEDTVEVDLPAEQIDIDSLYDEAMDELLRNERPEEEPPRFNQEDYYRSFRTHLVLVWIACNTLLVAIVTSSSYRDPEDDSVLPKTAANSYMMAMLWVNAGLAAFRFSGSIIYLVLRLFSS